MNKYTYQIELSTLTGEVEAETQQQAEQEVVNRLLECLKKKKFVFNNSVMWVAQKTPKVKKGRFIEHE
jgi:hypothetical protein